MHIKHIALLVILGICLAMGQPAIAEQPTIHNTRISMGYDGSQSDGASYYPIISNSERFVVFWSEATNLVPNDTNGVSDVFVFDLETEVTERVSVDATGLEGNQASGFGDLAGISDDGRYVVFSSQASNLVANDTNIFCDEGGTNECINRPDIFVKDRLTGEVRLVSVSSEGVQGNDASSFPSISADGRYVAFVSEADNLVENDTNGFNDIFVHDLQTGETRRVSIASDGTQTNDGSFANRISADGQYVVFDTRADNLSAEDIDDQLDVYSHNLQTGETKLISGGLPQNGNNRYAPMPDISADGQYVSFFSGTNGTGSLDNTPYIYRHNQQTELTEVVSTSASGQIANRGSTWASISGDGRWVAFTSRADNLVDVAGSVCNECENVYLKDMDTGAITLVNKNIVGHYPNSPVALVSISGEGRYVVFDSSADDLVLADTNKHQDIFIYGWKTTEIYSTYLPLALKAYNYR